MKKKTALVIIILLILSLCIPQSRQYITQVISNIHEKYFTLDDLIGMNEEQLKLSREYNSRNAIEKFEYRTQGVWKLKTEDKSVDSKMMIRTRDHKVDFFTDGVMEASYTWKLFADVGDYDEPIYYITYVELDSREAIEIKGNSLFLTSTDEEGKPTMAEYVRISE